MNCWLDPVRRVLDDAMEPITFFFRNDDVGWDEAQLFQLLEIFEARSVPIDLAVIPTEISNHPARRLSERLRLSAGRIRLHQHGYRHANYQISGRKCEFGRDRNVADQADDLKAGQRRLVEAFDDLCDPIFTPPWNRCTQATADLLGAGFYQALSRDIGAQPLHLDDLCEIPVCIDWCEWEARPEGRSGLGREIASYASQDIPIGTMLHHAEMSRDSRAAVKNFLDLLVRHPNAKCVSMRSLIMDKEHRESPHRKPNGRPANI